MKPDGDNPLLSEDLSKPASCLSITEELERRFSSCPPLILGTLPLPTYQFTAKGPVLLSKPNKGK